MKFLDKLNDIAEKAIKKVEDVGTSATEIYKKEGMDGFLDRANKGLNNVERKAVSLGNKTADYFKEVGKRTDAAVKEANKDTKDEFEASVNAGVVKTVSTVQVVATDIAEKAKSVFRDLTSNDNTKERVDTEQLDSIKLEEVLKFLGAKVSLENPHKYINAEKEEIVVSGNNWYNFNNQKGGKGAISLLSSQLEKVNQPPVKADEKSMAKYKKEIYNEAINILGHLENNLNTPVQSVTPEIKKPVIKKVSKVEAPKPVASKKVVTKKAVAKKVVKENPPVEKKAKKVPLKKTEPVVAKKTTRKKQ